MKTFVWFLLSVVLLGAFCDVRPEFKQEIDTLTIQRDGLLGSVEHLGLLKAQLESEVKDLKEKKTSLFAEKGGNVRYVLRLSIRQVHWSLSIRKQIADAVNEEEFQIYVDRETYTKASVGQDLFESFRAGSAVMKGSLGTWRIKVVQKTMEEAR